MKEINDKIRNKKFLWKNKKKKDLIKYNKKYKKINKFIYTKKKFKRNKK